MCRGRHLFNMLFQYHLICILHILRVWNVLYNKMRWEKPSKPAEVSSGTIKTGRSEKALSLWQKSGLKLCHCWNLQQQSDRWFSWLMGWKWVCFHDHQNLNLTRWCDQQTVVYTLQSFTGLLSVCQALFFNSFNLITIGISCVWVTERTTRLKLKNLIFMFLRLLWQNKWAANKNGWAQDLEKLIRAHLC